MILTPTVIAATCTTPDHEAAVVAAVTPAPDVARGIKAPATAIIAVTIGSDGKLVSAKVAQSSKNPMLDQAALDAASKTTYSPKVVNCQGVTDSYAFPYTFEPATATPKPSPSPRP
jgi:TonB family protein